MTRRIPQTLWLALAAGLCSSVSLAQDAGLPAWSSFDVNGQADGPGGQKVDAAAPAAGPHAWPFRISAEEIALRTADDSGLRASLDKVLSRLVPVVEGSTPNYYMFMGSKIAMNLDNTRVAVLVRDDIPDNQVEMVAERALQDSAVAVIPGRTMRMRHWAIVSVAEPIKSFDDAGRMVADLSKHAMVSFASPVLQNSVIADGFYIVTPDILARVVPALRAAGAAAPTVDGFTVTDPKLGGMDGAMKLHASSRNGFEVLAACNRLAQNPSFAWAEPDALQSLELFGVPNDTLFNTCWQSHNTGQNGGQVDFDMDGPEAWDITTGNSTIKTLVCDVGTQLNHPDLNVLAGRNFTDGTVSGFSDGSPEIACDNHGTAVAGCISAKINNNLGVAGIAADTRTMPAKIADMMNNPPTCTNSFVGFSPSWVANALAFGVAQGVKITNHSYGVGFSQTMVDAFQNSWVNNGVVHFAAAGNGGTNTLSFPASSSYVLSVASLTQYGLRASSSQYGVGLDLSAPGASVGSTDRTGTDGYSSTDYNVVSGTSFASPDAAGVLALFWSRFTFASQAEAIAAMLDGCVDLGAAGYDTDYGQGFVNAYNALIDPGPSNDFCASATTVTLDASNTYNPAVRDTRWAVEIPREPQESCEAGGVGTSNSVFYRFTAPNTGLMSINTNGSNYDTVLSVFDGCGFTFSGLYFPPNQLACDDDGGTGTQSQLTDIPVTAGQSYIIKVSDYGAPGGGNLDFNLTFTPTPPPNDSCSSATVIPGTFGVYNPPLLDTEFATTSSTCELSSSCGSSAGNSNSVFYSFTPAADGLITVDTLGTNYDTVLSIHSGCSVFIFGVGCTQPRQYACNDDGGPNLTSLISNFQVSAGSTYIIKVADYGSPGGGLLDFNVNFVPLPPSCNADYNDDGSVDLSDVFDLSNDIAAGTQSFPPHSPDFNSDGSADLSDVLDISNVVAGGPCP